MRNQNRRRFGVLDTAARHPQAPSVVFGPDLCQDQTSCSSFGRGMQGEISPAGRLRPENERTIVIHDTDERTHRQSWPLTRYVQDGVVVKGVENREPADDRRNNDGAPSVDDLGTVTYLLRYAIVPIGLLVLPAPMPVPNLDLTSPIGSCEVQIPRKLE